MRSDENSSADTCYVTQDKWTSLPATELTFTSGRQVASAYDALYRRTTVTETSGGTSIAAWQFFGDRIALITLGNGLTASFMNNAQNRSAVQSGQTTPGWGDKTTDRLGYDGSGRLIAKRYLPAASTTSLVGFTTEYDPSYNKLFERALNAESRSNLYPSYDSMDRLLEYERGTLASGGGSISTPTALPAVYSDRTYNLDGLGNWQNTTYVPVGGAAATETRQHNKLNEVTQFGVSPASTPVLYDHGNNSGTNAARGNGNITDDGTRVYVYDALNRLTTVKRKSDGATIAQYVYDALGRRVRKAVSNGGVTGTIANTTSRYISSGSQIVEELDGTNATVRQFIWGQYIDELIQMKTLVSTGSQPLAAGTYYPLQDLLYRTTALTNGSAAVVEAYDTDAYGNTLIYKGPGADGIWFTDDDVRADQPACETIFTGRQYDPETKIYYYRARYYQPGLGRFVGRDYVDYAYKHNLYDYVGCRPTGGLDPSGLDDIRIHDGNVVQYMPEGFLGRDLTDRAADVGNVDANGVVTLGPGIGGQIPLSTLEGIGSADNYDDLVAAIRQAQSAAANSRGGYTGGFSVLDFSFDRVTKKDCKDLGVAAAEDKCMHAIVVRAGALAGLQNITSAVETGAAVASGIAGGAIATRAPGYWRLASIPFLAFAAYETYASVDSAGNAVLIMSAAAKAQDLYCHCRDAVACSRSGSNSENV